MIKDVGYRHIDTATMYENEDIIGEVLAELFAEGVITREDIFVTTKVKNADFLDVEGSVRTSLEKLKLAQADLVLLHGPLPP